MKTVFEPMGTQNLHPITPSTDGDFLLLLQQGLLLGLKEEGLLNEMQHRQAEEILLLQVRKKTNPNMEKA